MNGTHDVFLSYKFEEKAEALAVKRALESAGLTCWMAPESISGGSSYADEIDGAIRGCSAFVLILSERAQSSPWIKKEIDVALNAGKLVLPFLIEEVRLRFAAAMRSPTTAVTAGDYEEIVRRNTSMVADHFGIRGRGRLEEGCYADVAVIDAVMAYASVGEGTDYADLMVVEGVELSKEEYGIGLRKGSNMTEKINEALQELTDDGTVAALAEKYPSVLVTLEPSA